MSCTKYKLYNFLPRAIITIIIIIIIIIINYLSIPGKLETVLAYWVDATKTPQRGTNENIGLSELKLKKQHGVCGVCNSVCTL